MVGSEQALQCKSRGMYRHVPHSNSNSNSTGTFHSLHHHACDCDVSVNAPIDIGGNHRCSVGLAFDARGGDKRNCRSPNGAFNCTTAGGPAREAGGAWHLLVDCGVTQSCWLSERTLPMSHVCRGMGMHHGSTASWASLYTRCGVLATEGAMLVGGFVGCL